MDRCKCCNWHTKGVCYNPDAEYLKPVEPEEGCSLWKEDPNKGNCKNCSWYTKSRICCNPDGDYEPMEPEDGCTLWEEE